MCVCGISLLHTLLICWMLNLQYINHICHTSYNYKTWSTAFTTAIRHLCNAFGDGACSVLRHADSDSNEKGLSGPGPFSHPAKEWGFLFFVSGKHNAINIVWAMVYSSHLKRFWGWFILGVTTWRPFVSGLFRSLTQGGLINIFRCFQNMDPAELATGNPKCLNYWKFLHL